jgi:signal transduction histidine kinase
MSSEPEHDDLIALNRLLTVERILAGTAHDVNNALLIIGGSAELLESQDGLSDAARRALIRIRGQSARAAGLIDDLMQFARDRGDQASRVGLKDLLAKAGAFRALMIRRAGLALEIPGDDATGAEVTGRAPQLLQIVLNMVMHAEQRLAQTKGGSITLLLAEERGEAVLRVLDNARETGDPGAAAPAAAAGRGAPARVAGLEAARLIARAHGGELSVEATPGGGCSTLRLPLARPG